ncbi:MAG TPA: EamA family transporter, partial [Pyrinomonadaceae bacterium]|nr:EamA family transporter [Pyrinomonadaceae bacterium]
YIALAALSLFGVTLNQILFIGGLSLTKAVNTSLLAVTIPIFTLIFSTLTGNEQITRRKVLGILLSITGVVLIIDPRKASFSSETTAGDILIVLNSICYAIYVSLSKKIITRNGPFRSMMWLFIFSSLVCVPLGYFSFSSMPENNVTPEIWLIVIYIAVAATAGAYLLNAFALSKVDPSIVASYIYLQPLVGLLLGVLFLGESVGLLFIMAALAIFAGLYLACFSKKKEDLEDLSVSTAPHY